MMNILSLVRWSSLASLLGFSIVCLSATGQQAAPQSDVAPALPSYATRLNGSETGLLQATTPQTASGGQAQTDSKAGSLPQQRKRRRNYFSRRKSAQSTQPVSSQPAQVSPSPEQRVRDQKILEQQQAQSARIARENDAVTKQVVQDQQRVQSEPRIQDAPGASDQPLPGAAVVPPSQPSEQPRIQDAPGPAQTLPKPAPVTPSAPQ